MHFSFPLILLVFSTVVVVNDEIPIMIIIEDRYRYSPIAKLGDFILSMAPRCTSMGYEDGTERNLQQLSIQSCLPSLLLSVKSVYTSIDPAQCYLKSHRGRGRMVVGFTTTYQSVVITTNVVNSNPAHSDDLI
jgi:hypothetical protein